MISSEHKILKIDKIAIMNPHFDKTKRLILIDGNALLHRAYHAMPNLTNKAGEPVNAVYGFFSMLINVLHEYQPAYLIICFDRSKPTVRQNMFASYHAHRPQMDGDLVYQIKLIDDLLTKFGVQITSVEGYEGDDLIGTYARQAYNEYKDLEIIIVTGDQDMLQLVNDRTKVLMSITGLTKTHLFDEKSVEEKYGIKPSQFVDFKALSGDPSDGYPGIRGIGPKTAKNLLQKFGTFEALYEHLGEIPEKIGEKLALDAEQGALAKKLATIITDAPVHLDLEKCRVERLDKEKLKKGFEEHGFKSLITRLDTKYPQKEKTKKKSTNGQLGLL